VIQEPICDVGQNRPLALHRTVEEGSTNVVSRSVAQSVDTIIIATRLTTVCRIFLMRAKLTACWFGHAFHLPHYYQKSYDKHNGRRICRPPSRLVLRHGLGERGVLWEDIRQRGDRGVAAGRMTWLDTFSLNWASPAMSRATPWHSSLISCPYAYTRSWLGSAQKALMPGPQRMMRDTRKHAERTRAIQRCGVRLAVIVLLRDWKWPLSLRLTVRR
jgi:hypothetical protein